MVVTEPKAELDSRFSSEDAAPTSWTEGNEVLRQAEIYWLSTVRPDGCPHVTPLIAIWMDDALHFCTGPEERKAKNLSANPRCVITTGCNDLDEGLDVIVEGEAARVTDEAKLQRLADAYPEKYEGWHFTVRDGAFYGDGGEALVFRVTPTKAFGFGRGEMYSQTRWRL
jgi:nitroimidazol reductase NimA-like FMN-containing flavoprotein (pyridoxamine 5'-phosphate oxidase superfamily)